MSFRIFVKEKDGGKLSDNPWTDLGEQSLFL